jgi:hypothetical protein
MKNRLFIGLVVFCSILASCGPDLDPKKYWVKSVLLSSYEEYDFTYKAGKIEKIVGTDLVTWDFRYYTDSTVVSSRDNSGSVFQIISLSFSGSLLTEWKTKWRFSEKWYSDSVQFTYPGSNLFIITYKKTNYLAKMENGNLTEMRRGSNLQYINSFDAISNPFKEVIWIDPFLKISGFNSSLRPNSIVRYFSANNLQTSTKNILGVKETEQYSYLYLHGILPKSINVNIQSSSGNFNDIVFVFDIQYASKEGASF